MVSWWVLLFIYITVFLTLFLCIVKIYKHIKHIIWGRYNLRGGARLRVGPFYSLYTVAYSKKCRQLYTKVGDRDVWLEPSQNIGCFS